jgi:uncharacterized membrane protein YhfC
VNFLLISLNYLLMVAIPIAVAIFIHRQTNAPWRLFFIGAATFILAQVFHIPFNWIMLRSNLIPTDTTAWGSLLFYALFLGLSAGVFEESARYLSYRYWTKDARTWSRGLMLGAGHGGIEAILLGLLAGINFIGLLIVTRSEALLSTFPADQLDAIDEALIMINTTPWYGLILGAVERVFAIITHLALSILVLQVFVRRSLWWLFLAIGYHAIFNMAAVIGIVRWGPYTTEGMLAGFALISLFLIFRLRLPDPPSPDFDPLPEPETIESVELRPTAETLDRSRYS